jgi:hypothetical protein
MTLFEECVGTLRDQKRTTKIGNEEHTTNHEYVSRQVINQFGYNKIGYTHTTTE